MTRINRAYVRRLEDLILQIDATLSELEPARALGGMERDMPVLRREADRIRDCRNARVTAGRGQANKSNGCTDE
jgi:hypothetical protein